MTEDMWGNILLQNELKHLLSKSCSQ